MKEYTIYKHTNKMNGKVYIGQTCLPVNERWKKGEGYKGCDYFYHAIQKYGWDNFEHEIIASNLTKEEADEMEAALIIELDTRNHEKGYNLKGGGSHGSYSLESRQKISDSLKGRKLSEEHKRKIGEAGVGRTHSEETKRKIALGRAVSVYCVELDRYFESAAVAGRELGIDASGIGKACRGTRDSAGKHPETKEKLHWRFA